MSRSIRFRWALPIAAGAVMALAAALGPANAAPAGAPGTWTKITATDSGFNTAGMLRTADGSLHLVWRKRLTNGHFSYGWLTISLRGALRASGTALSNWVGLQGDPKLVPDGRHLRLIFIGGQDTNPNNFFSAGAVYTQLSSGGTSWALVHGSMAFHTVLNLGLAAAVRSDGSTPVAAFGLNNVLYFHTGVDPSAPAATADGTAATGPIATGIAGDVLARDKNGSIWVSWFDQGYWARQILPSAGPVKKAPHSGAATGPDNEPRQSVAFAARQGGGLYLAYCAPSSVLPCARINLWRAGSSRVMVVPGSATGQAGRVSLAATPGGRLWVTWFDFGTNTLHSVRTNKAASRFGLARTIAQPPATLIFDNLQTEGSSGRLDILVNVLRNKPGNPVEFWHTQILAGLALAARPSSFSHRTTTTVTFTVTDAGDPVPGATVSCLGKHANTNAQGRVTLKFRAGTRTGSHVCVASASAYLPGKTTIRVR